MTYKRGVQRPAHKPDGAITSGSWSSSQVRQFGSGGAVAINMATHPLPIPMQLTWARRVGLKTLPLHGWATPSHFWTRVRPCPLPSPQGGLKPGNAFCWARLGPNHAPPPVELSHVPPVGLGWDLATPSFTTSPTSYRARPCPLPSSWGWVALLSPGAALWLACPLLPPPPAHPDGASCTWIWPVHVPGTANLAHQAKKVDH